MVAGKREFKIDISYVWKIRKWNLCHIRFFLFCLLHNCISRSFHQLKFTNFIKSRCFFPIFRPFQVAKSEKYKNISCHLQDVKCTCTFTFINIIKNPGGWSCNKRKLFARRTLRKSLYFGNLCITCNFYTFEVFTPKLQSCNSNNNNNNNNVRSERFMAGRAIFARERWNRSVARHAVPATTFSLVRPSPSTHERSLLSRTTAERNERRFYERKSKDSKAFRGNSKTVFQSKVMHHVGTHWL